MRSIIEEIANAEAQADRIRLDAAASARELIAKAQEQAEQALAGLDAQERQITAEALESAQAEGEQLAQTMQSAMETEADAICRQAEDRLESAAAYLLEKVQETA